MSMEWYWKELAILYDLPVELVREMYEVWDEEEYPDFSNYVKELKEEACTRVVTMT